MSNVMYGCCVGNWSRFDLYVADDDRQIMALSGQPSIAEAYNKIIKIARTWGADMLVLQHDDLEIIDDHAEKRLLAATSQHNVLVAGVAGGRGVDSLAWWNAETFGHQLTDSGPLELGPREGDVDILEGSLLAFSREGIGHLSFDTGFEGFHGYDELTYRATRMGGRAVVADIDTYHHVALGFKSSESEQAWHIANDRFRRKWGFA